jgi:hypothetical protein
LHHAENVQTVELVGEPNVLLRYALLLARKRSELAIW